MRSPPWKRLVEELADSEFESPYLDRLLARVSVEQAQHDLEREILQEMASALGRAEERVNWALLQLELIDREVEDALRTATLNSEARQHANERIRAYNRQRSVAQHHLWELLIHRESLGFTRNEILSEFYPIPPPKEALPPES